MDYNTRMGGGPLAKAKPLKRQGWKGGGLRFKSHRRPRIKEISRSKKKKR
ncbi:hypothetical protein HanRHA438_Chr11g0506651 [Helianthus annuus]|nr:hypothetical protein HanRHA438_Chr11g0506651 [Helianthus annuus]